MSSRWLHPVAALVVSLLCGVLVLVATRLGPLLSPDSITYLSAAEHLRSGAGLTDFTGKPLTVFGPVYPILLSIGGRSLLWARVVGALAVAVATFLMFVLLRGRVRPWAAVAGAAVFGASQGLVRVASTAWSESPYAAISLGTLVVLAAARLTPRRAAVGGLLAGLGFLTRYAGAGLIVTGAVMVAIASLGTGRRLAVRNLSAYCGVAAATSATWVVRDLMRAGEPLGPRFEGGAAESLATLLRRPIPAVGQLMVGDQSSKAITERAGLMAIAALAVAAIVVLRHWPPRSVDLGVVVFGWTSLIVPVAARALTSNDIGYRVMSPTLIPIVYLAVVAIDRVRRWRAVVVVGVCLAGWWVYQGVAMAERFPEFVTRRSELRSQSSPKLYELVEELPQTATVLTNSPHSVWWLTGREPMLLAFTRPRPGSSHYPLSADETLAYACRGDTYLAWFAGLGNAGQGPSERRPDIAAVVGLTLERSVPGGALYHLTARDEGLCRPHRMSEGQQPSAAALPSR